MEAKTMVGRAGSAKVENPIQLQILEALQGADLQLDDLVRITGKSKSALSGVYLKELVALGLVVERPHPGDQRKKLFSLEASPAPVSPTGQRGLSLGIVLDALLEAGSPTSVARAIGRRLPPLPSTSPQVFATALGRFAEDESLATHLQLDYEGLRFRCLPGPLVEGRDPAAVGALLAALAHGMAEAAGVEAGFSSEVDGHAFSLQGH